MKKTALIIAFVLSVNMYSLAQKGSIIYGHKQSMGMGAPIGIDYNAVLIFDSQKSKYTFAKDSLEGKPIRESVMINKDDDNIFFVPKSTSELGFEYYLDRSKGLLLSRDIGFTYVKEDLPKIEWNITNEKKTIGNFDCTKASGCFRGRKYTAWFATSIPLPYGPWKLQGLPGLILEAYDTNKEVYFYFKSLEYPSKNKMKITCPNPKTEGKDWIGLSGYKDFLINSYKTAIENGRMFVEQNDSAMESIDTDTFMGNSYIEVFQEN